MCPVHEAAKVIPLVHATHLHPVAHTQGDALCEVDVMRDEQRSAIADIDYETLMSRAVIVIRQQASDEASHFDPLAVIAFRERLIQIIKSAAGRPWPPRFLVLA